MFLKPSDNVFNVLLASAVLVLAVPRIGLSQDESPLIIFDDTIDALDEIIVYGEPPLRLLRDEVYAAEENFYEMFNVLNEGRQFDIECFYRRPIGSHIPRRVCEANFIRNSHYTFNVGGSGPPKWAYVRHKSRQMIMEMEALVAEHANLHAALMDFADAKQTFDSAIRARCANRRSICRQ